MRTRFWTPRSLGPWLTFLALIAILSVVALEIPSTAPLVRRALQVLGFSIVWWPVVYYRTNGLSRCSLRRSGVQPAPPSA